MTHSRGSWFLAPRYPVAGVVFPIGQLRIVVGIDGGQSPTGQHLGERRLSRPWVACDKEGSHGVSIATPMRQFSTIADRATALRSREGDK